MAIYKRKLKVLPNGVIFLNDFSVSFTDQQRNYFHSVTESLYSFGKFLYFCGLQAVDGLSVFSKYCFLKTTERLAKEPILKTTRRLKKL